MDELFNYLFNKLFAAFPFDHHIMREHFYEFSMKLCDLMRFE